MEELVLISSRLLAESPIVKDKSSFLIAGRSSYAHLFLKVTDNQNSAYFYDLNTKLNYKINDKKTTYIYQVTLEEMYLILNNQFMNTYGNAVLNVRWNHLFFR